MTNWIDGPEAKPLIAARDKVKAKIVAFDAKHEYDETTPGMLKQRAGLVSQFQTARGELQKAQAAAREAFFKGIAPKDDALPEADPYSGMSD